MTTTGKFEKSLIGLKIASVELSKFSIAELDAGSVGEKKQITINGTGSQNLTLSFAPVSEFSNSYSISISGTNINSNIINKSVDSLIPGEEVSIKFNLQDEKIILFIDDNLINSSYFPGRLSSFTTSGSGLNFDNINLTNPPNVRILIPSIESLESRENLLTILPDPNLNLKITGIDLMTIDSRAAGFKIFSAVNIILSGDHGEKIINKYNTSGVSGLLSGAWDGDFL